MSDEQSNPNDLDRRRSFNGREHVALYLAADGRCARCGAELTQGWHADHVIPHSKNGETDVINGQALCPTCNLKKGATMNRLDGFPRDLRDYQQNALERFFSHLRDFLMVATPGAGKTVFALACAYSMLSDSSNGIDRVIVVVPRASLRHQWQREAHKVGIQLDPDFQNRETIFAADYCGAVATYQQIVKEPLLWRKITSSKRTLVIFDEIHHAGEAEHLSRGWGAALRQAFEPAQRRLLLTGTPFRSDQRAIPFCRYDESGKVIPDFSYDYGEALREDVVRPVEFSALNGQMPTFKICLQTFPFNAQS